MKRIHQKQDNGVGLSHSILVNQQGVIKFYAEDLRINLIP